MGKTWTAALEPAAPPLHLRGFLLPWASVEDLRDEGNGLAGDFEEGQGA